MLPNFKLRATRGSSIESIGWKDYNNLDDNIPQGAIAESSLDLQKTSVKVRTKVFPTPLAIQNTYFLFQRYPFFDMSDVLLFYILVMQI